MFLSAGPAVRTGMEFWRVRSVGANGRCQHSAGDPSPPGVRFLSKKKTTIHKGTIDSRCHPDSEKKLFSISADTILPLRSKPRDGMISPLCNVRETASILGRFPFPSLLTESIRTKSCVPAFHRPPAR